VFVADVHVKFAFSVIAFVPFPINKRPPVKLFAPVPPLVTANVPSLILVAFILLKPAPEPLNKFEVIVPVAVMFVVLIPPKQYKIPLKVVLILLEYA